MFESGIIDFDITIYFNDNTSFSINSSALVSIGDIVSQITDDDPISKSNNFNIELLARLLPEPAQFSPQNIKYIECLGKWRCESVTFKDDKCIFTCSGFLQNAKNVEYLPPLPRDGYQFVRDSLNALWGQNNIFNTDSLAVLNTTCGQKLCEQQKIWEYRFESNHQYTFNNKTYANNFKTLDIKFSTPEDFFNKTLWDLEGSNDDYAEFSWNYQNIFQGCGNSIVFGTNNTFYTGQLNVYTMISGSYYLLFPCYWTMTCDSQKPYICQWNKDVFDTVSNYYLNAGTITQSQIDNALADHKLIDNISLNTTDATYGGMTYHFKADLNSGFDVWPVTNSATNTGTYTTTGKWYSVDNVEYSIDHVKEALKLLSLSVNENANGAQVIKKTAIFDNDPVLSFDCNNINNLQLTNEFYNVYDGGKITIKYLSAKDGEPQEFNFYTNCAWPEVYTTDLLNFVVNPQCYTAYSNNTYVMNTNNNQYNRLGACSGFELQDTYDAYNNYYLQWYWPRKTYLTDCENNIYAFQGAYTEELHYDQDHDIDGQFFQRAYFCFNKNNKIADYRTSKNIEYDFDKMPVPAGCKKEFVDITKVKDKIALYDVGFHAVYQMETNLSAIDICAGQRATLQNIRDFGNENAIYDILIINRQIHLLSGSCTVQFIILDSDYTGKIGFNEKSKWQQYYNHWYLRNYENTDVESPADLLNTTQKIHVMCKNLNTGWQKEFIVTDLFSQDNTFTYSCAMPYEVAEFLYGENTNNSVSLRYDVGAGMKVSLNSVALPDLSNKIVALKYGKTTPNNLQNFGDMSAGTWIWNGSRIDSQWQKKPYDIISNLTSTPNKLQLIIMNSAGTTWTGTGTSWDSSNSRFVVSSPYSTVITNAYVKLSGNAVQIDMVVRSTYRNNFPASHSWANALWNADFTLKEDCKVLVKRIE